MNKKIKKVIREGTWETNSSSSHSLAIYMNGDLVKRGDPDFDLKIKKNVLYVPGREDFGWEYEKTNSTLTKLQYASALICHDIETAAGHKKIKRFKNILTSYLGVSDVVFEWDTKYFDGKSKSGPGEDVWRPIPNVDHQSFYESWEEITENTDTLINFIFSRKSWLYGGNDNSDVPEDYYIETQVRNPTVAIMSVDFGGNIGRVDFELNDFPCRDIIETLFDDDNGNVALLNSIYYDPTDKEMKVDSVYGDGFSKKASLEDELKKLTFQSDVEIYKEGKLYFMWAGGKDWNEKYHELATVNNSKNRKYRNIPLDLYNSGDLVEGKDYVLYPVSIKSDEFGEL